MKERVKFWHLFNMGKNNFNKIAKFASRPLITQLLWSPFRLVPLFAFFKTLRFLKLSINLSAATFWGQRLIGAVPDPTFAFIYLYGFSDEGLTRMLIQSLHKGDTFIDIGAHIGYETLLGSNLVGERGKVFAFEPTPETYKLLYKNVRLSKNVYVASLAAWSKNRPLTLFDYGPSLSGLNGAFAPRVEKSALSKLKPNTINVFGISIDEFCRLYEVKPDFVKIDAESAEYDILLGMKNVIKSAKPKIVLEIGDMPNERGRTRKCIKFLTNLEYNAFEYKNGKVVQHRPNENYFGIYDNLLFIPTK